MDNLELLEQHEFVHRSQKAKWFLVCPLCHTDEGIETQDDGWGEENTYWSINFCSCCSFMWETVLAVAGYVPITNAKEIEEIKATWGVQLEMPFEVDLTDSKEPRKLVDWH